MILTEDRKEGREDHFGHRGAEKLLLGDKNTPHAACPRDPVGLYSRVFCNCM